MSDRIYVRAAGGKMEELEAQPFDSEDAIQRLIAEHPDLIGGGRIRPRDPRRWLLIKREQGVPDTPGAGDRWAVDHLLIDQDGVPTLVEVKRGSNTQIRREVVGQLLEYAAHARHTWDVGDLRRTFEEREDWQGELRVLLDAEDEPDADEFWQGVETNLDASNLRLLVVADSIPDELARIVEFLNEQMSKVEVLAVEVKRYSGGASETFVPTVIGALAARPSKSGGTQSSRRWTHETFPEAFTEPAHRHAAQRLLETARQAGGVVVEPGPRGVSLRARVAGQYYTVAWLLAPDTPESSWLPVREFTFGSGTNGGAKQNPDEPKRLDNLTGDLGEILRKWARQFAGDAFTREDPRADLKNEGIEAWVVGYDDAAKHIDVLTERLERVLAELKAL